MIIHSYLDDMEYGKPYNFGRDWFIVKYRKNIIQGDRYLLFDINENDEIENAIYGKMVDYEPTFLAVKGMLLNKDVCRENYKVVNTYRFGKSWYLMTCPKSKEEKLTNEAKKLLSNLNSYFLVEKVK